MPAKKSLFRRNFFEGLNICACVHKKKNPKKKNLEQNNAAPLAQQLEKM